MAMALYRHGIPDPLRNSAGQDVDGGCGQLRARAGKPPRRTLTIVPPAPDRTACGALFALRRRSIMGRSIASSTDNNNGWRDA